MNYISSKLLIVTKAKILLSLILVLTGLSSYSQNGEGELTIQGNCQKFESKEMLAASISIFEKNIKIKDLTCSANGRFKFKLAYYGNYIVRFKYPGCAEMYMTISSKTYPELDDRNSTVEIPVMFWDNNDDRINKKAFISNPFTKISFAAQYSEFRDDLAYHDHFINNLLPNKQVELQAENKDAKNKQDQIALAAKARHDAILAAKKAAQNKTDDKNTASPLENVTNTKQESNGNISTQDQIALAAKARHDAILAAKNVKQKNNENSQEDDFDFTSSTENEKKTTQNTINKINTETDAITYLQNQKNKELEIEQNKRIKLENDNNIFQLVGEGEKAAKQNNNEKLSAEVSQKMMVERMKKENEIKDNYSIVKDQEIRRQETISLGKSKNNEHLTELILVAARNEKNIKMLSGKRDTISPEKIKIAPKVIQSNDNGEYKKTKITRVIYNDKEDIYKKSEFIWGTIYYYKNDILIEKYIYYNELQKLVSNK